MKTWIYILLTIILFSCKNDSQINNSKTYNYHFGDQFTLKINDFAILSPVQPSNNSDSTLKICFEKIIKDGRCYKSDCYLCFGSIADIQISVIHKGDTSNLKLTIIGCSNNDEPLCNEQYYYRKDTLGFRVCLLKLDPYPDYNNTPIDPSSYTAKFEIIKL